MAQQFPILKLYGRIFLTMNIRALTGLRIGGSPSALQIGGLDNVVIRDPLTQRPYIPGSSLRGKLRSLWEKSTGAPQNFTVRRGNPTVRLHSLTADEVKGKTEAEVHQIVHNDPVYRVFGVTGDVAVPNPTRLVIHDVMMSDESAASLEMARTDQPYTEIKWESTIDRITSAAVPRQMERVPAGTVFAGARLVYSLYGLPDLHSEIAWFGDLITMLQLAEDDYLGSSGSRGSGLVAFENLSLAVRLTGDFGERYSQLIPVHDGVYPGLDTFSQHKDPLLNNIHQVFGA